MNVSGILSGTQNDGLERRIQRKGQKLLQYVDNVKRDQAKAGSTLVGVIGKQETALRVGGEQAGYRFQEELLKFGRASKDGVQHPIAGSRPPIKAQDKIEIGFQGLKSTPDVYRAYYLLRRSDNTLKKASKAEDKLLKAKTQQALNQGKKPPEPLPKLIKPDLPNHILHSPLYTETLANRYGAATKPNNIQPKPVGYHSSKGWIYDTQPVSSTKPDHKPEDLSWMHDRLIGWEQVAQLNGLNGGRR